MTGSGLSVSQLYSYLVVASSSPWPGELAKGPSLVPPLSLPPRPLVSQCEAHGPPIGVGREKNSLRATIFLVINISLPPEPTVA